MVTMVLYGQSNKTVNIGESLICEDDQLEFCSTYLGFETFIISSDYAAQSFMDLMTILVLRSNLNSNKQEN